MLLHQGLRSESIFQNSGVCLLLPICAIAWDTNLEVLELDLISVSHEEGTEPEFSLWGVWDSILVPMLVTQGLSVGHSESYTEELRWA